MPNSPTHWQSRDLEYRCTSDLRINLVYFHGRINSSVTGRKLLVLQKNHSLLCIIQVSILELVLTMKTHLRDITSTIDT